LRGDHLAVCAWLCVGDGVAHADVAQDPVGDVRHDLLRQVVAAKPNPGIAAGLLTVEPGTLHDTDNGAGIVVPQNRGAVVEAGQVHSIRLMAEHFRTEPPLDGQLGAERKLKRTIFTQRASIHRREAV